MADMKFLDTLEEVLLERGFPLNIVKSVLETAQTIDAVPVVRCRDCKHWHKETLFCDYMPYGEARERVNWYTDDFCSYGERKDGDGNG